MYEITPFSIAVFAFVFSVVLMQQGSVFYFYSTIISRLPTFFYRALGGCSKCFAGQLAFWYGFQAFGFSVHHILFTAYTILICLIFEKIYYNID